MKTIIYINDDVIQIVKARGRRYKYDFIPLQEGTVSKGEIIDRDELIKTLKMKRKKCKKATVVLDSSCIEVCKMKIPKLNKKKTLAIVKDLFDFNAADEYVYAYNVLHVQNKENVVVGCSVPRELLESYQSVLKAAKVKVLRMDVAENGLMKYLSKSPMFKGKTFVMNVVTGASMISIFFENGVYKLSKKYVNPYQVNSEEYVEALYANALDMIDSGTVKGGVQKVVMNYYIGLETVVMRAYKRYVRRQDASQMGNLVVESYSDMDKDLDYIIAIAGSLENRKDVELKKIPKIQNKKGRTKKQDEIANVSVDSHANIAEISESIEITESIGFSGSEQTADEWETAENLYSDMWMTSEESEFTSEESEFTSEESNLISEERSLTFGEEELDTTVSHEGGIESIGNEEVAIPLKPLTKKELKLEKKTQKKEAKQKKKEEKALKRDDTKKVGRILLVWGEFVILLGVITLILFATQLLTDENATQNSAIDALQNYVDAKAVENQSIYGSAYSGEMVISEMEQYTWVAENIEDSQLLTPEIMDEILGGMVTIHSLAYDFSTREIAFGGYGNSQSDVLSYSTDIRESGYFDNQYYNGYSVAVEDSESLFEFSIEASWNMDGSEVAADDEEE